MCTRSLCELACGSNENSNRASLQAKAEEEFCPATSGHWGDTIVSTAVARWCGTKPGAPPSAASASMRFMEKELSTAHATVDNRSMADGTQSTIRPTQARRRDPRRAAPGGMPQPQRRKHRPTRHCECQKASQPLGPAHRECPGDPQDEGQATALKDRHWCTQRAGAGEPHGAQQQFIRCTPLEALRPFSTWCRSATNGFQNTRRHTA